MCVTQFINKLAKQKSRPVWGPQRRMYHLHTPRAELVPWGQTFVGIPMSCDGPCCPAITTHLHTPRAGLVFWGPLWGPPCPMMALDVP